MVKAISLSVYKNPRYKGCANGGYSEDHDAIYIEAPDGYVEVAEDDPALFKLVNGAYGSIHLEPKVKPLDMVGPMMGGSYAACSDARFGKICEEKFGRRFYGAVAIHDRFESPEQYAAMSV